MPKNTNIKSLLIFRKTTQPHMCGPIRAQHTDEVADPKIVTVASNNAAVLPPEYRLASHMIACSYLARFTSMPLYLEE